MKSLNEDMKTGQFKQVYLLCGEEAYLKNQYKRRLRSAILGEEDTMNFSSFEGKGIDVRRIIDQAETMPFFAQRRLIQIENSGFFKSASPELADYIPQMSPATVLIFIEDEVDKRGRLYKAVKKAGRIVEMGRQDNRTLTAWILSAFKREGKKITSDALELFLDKTGNDMENIANELEKLFSYVLDQEAVGRAEVEAVCTVTTESRVFEMVGAVVNRQQKKALELYYDLLALKEPPMRILYLIGRQFNQMLLLRDLREQGCDNKTIASKAGLAPFIVNKSLAQSQRFLKEELIQAVSDCVKAEEAVKTGRLGDRLAVEMIIIQKSE